MDGDFVPNLIYSAYHRPIVSMVARRFPKPQVGVQILLGLPDWLFMGYYCGVLYVSILYNQICFCCLINYKKETRLCLLNFEL